MPVRVLPLLVSVTVSAALVTSCGDDAAEPRLEPATTTVPADTTEADTTTGDDTTTSTATPDSTTTSAATPDSITTSTEAPAPTTSRQHLDPDDPDYPTLPPSPSVTYPDTGDGT